MNTNNDLKAAIGIIQNSLESFYNELNDLEINAILQKDEDIESKIKSQSDIKFIASWALPTVEESERRSRRIIIQVPFTKIDEDGLISALDRGMPGFTVFLSSFNPEHNLTHPFSDHVKPPSKTYIIDY